VRIFLCKGRTFVSKLIEWQTRSPYSHCAVYYAGWVYEAREFKGVRTWHAPDRPEELEKLMQSKFDIFDVPTTPAQDAIILEFLRGQIGKRYDYLSVLRFLTREKAARESSTSWFCSELVFAAFLQAGIALLARSQPWEVSPGLLARSPSLKLIYG
jgi:uncharacterized protein YycO